MAKEIQRRTRVDFTPGGSVSESKIYKFTPDEDIKNLLIYQVKRAITKLYKSHLTQLEDLQQEHMHSLKKVEDLVSSDFISMIHFFDAERHGYYRKKTLDVGNETVRELENLLENFEIQLKR